MRTWVYALCFNEAHFVGNFLTAYKDAEKIIVYDNMSTDCSVELLRQDPRVEIRTWDSGGQIRDDLYLDIKNNCWKEAGGFADWVIVVDFDEVFGRVTPSVFDLDLTKPYEDGFTIIKPYGYNMISKDAPVFTKEHPFSLSNKGTYHEPAEKMCCFRPDKITEINFKPGCHHASPTGDVRVYRDKDYKLLHFKAWNFDLYMDRFAMYKKRLSDVNKEKGWGFQYQDDIEAQRNMYLAGINLAKDIFTL